MIKYIKSLSLSLVLLLSVAANLALAAPTDEAKARLELTVNKVLTEMDKPELANPATRQQVLANIEAIILTLFDFNELSKRTVGQSWQGFTPDQQKRFEDAFASLLRETYLGKLTGYDGETVSYLGETASSKGNVVEIQTRINLKDHPVPVNYRMIKKDEWMVYDVIIEGVSMVQNYRTQFNDLLSKGDAEQLITKVNEKAVEMKEHNRQEQTAQ